MVNISKRLVCYLPAGDVPLPRYQDWDTRVKAMKNNRTVKDLWGLMLCAVPGVTLAL